MTTPLYANIAAGKVEANTKPTNSTASSSSTTVSSAGNEALEAPKQDESLEKTTDNSPKDGDKSAKKEKKDKSKALPKKKLVAAPPPTVSAWGTASSPQSSTALIGQSPLAQSLRSESKKAPVAKNTGKEKWVPYAALVVLPGKKPKKKSKKKLNSTSHISHKTEAGSLSSQTASHAAGAQNASSTANRAPQNASNASTGAPESTKKLENGSLAAPIASAASAAAPGSAPPQTVYEKKRYPRSGFRGGRGGKPFSHQTHNNYKQFAGAPPQTLAAPGVPVAPGAPTGGLAMAPNPPAPYMGAPFVPMYYPYYPVYTPPFTPPTSLTQQIEYYFLEENLQKDVYLRQQMDSEGWISIKTISGFNRVQRLLGGDLVKVEDAMKALEKLEVNDGQVRLKEGYEKYILKPKVDEA